MSWKPSLNAQPRSDASKRRGRASLPGLTASRETAYLVTSFPVCIDQPGALAAAPLGVFSAQDRFSCVNFGKSGLGDMVNVR
jgi:hypothetical protein